MGWLRKKAKQLGKGIKKIVKKVSRAIGKLGIVGQIGLMMFMPTIAGSLWGSLGSFAAKGTSLIHKAAGAIFNAGNAIGSAYSTVTEAIGNGLNRATNFLKGEGFVLSPERTSIFTSTDKATDLTAKVSDSLGDKVVDTVSGGETTVVAEKITEESSKGLLAKGKDYVKEGIEGAKEALSDPRTLVKESLESGAKSGLASRVSYAAAGDPPTQKIISANFDVGSVNSYASTGTFNTEDFTRGNLAYQALGSSWGAGSSVAAPFLTEYRFSDGDIDYAKRVTKLRYTG
jgi:hypothetical protein